MQLLHLNPQNLFKGEISGSCPDSQQHIVSLRLTGIESAKLLSSNAQMAQNTYEGNRL